MKDKPCLSTERPATHSQTVQRREEKINRLHAKCLAVNREKLATRLKPLMAGLDSTDPSVECCPICHQALLPEIGRCNIFHLEADFDLVKSRFLQGPRLRRRGWSIPDSRGGYRAGVLRFLGDALAYLPKDFNSDRFDITQCIPLYSKTEVEAVEQTLEFRAFVENAHKADKRQIAKEAAAMAARQTQKARRKKNGTNE